MSKKLFIVLRLLSTILKGLFITVSIFIILLMLVICAVFIRIEWKTRYELYSSYFMKSRILEEIEDIRFTSASYVSIKLRNPSNTLHLDKILISYNERNIGEIVINKPLKGDGNIFEYSMEKDLIKIFGKENEKYSISEPPFAQDDFMFEVIIIDSHTKKEYRYKNEVLISFVKKGVNLWVPSI